MQRFAVHCFSLSLRKGEAVCANSPFVGRGCVGYGWVHWCSVKFSPPPSFWEHEPCAFSIKKSQSLFPYFYYSQSEEDEGDAAPLSIFFSSY